MAMVMVRMEVGAALARPSSACLRPGSGSGSVFLLPRQARPLVLSSRSSVFFSSRLRVRHRYVNPNPGGRRVLRRELVRAEARGEEEEEGERGESVRGGGEEELEEEEGEEGEDGVPQEEEEEDWVFDPFGGGDDEEEERVGPVSWLKEKFRRKSKEELEAEAEEKTAEALETIQQSEIKRLDEENEIERQGEIQAEREMIQNTMISKNIMKFQGRLKGSPWDPLPGEDIPYSVFMQLLEEKRVQYVDYGEFGQYVAVIMPYEKEEAQEESIVDSSEQATEQYQSDELEETVPKAPKLMLPDEDKLVFKRHLVDQMPADGWNDVWKKLHAQVSHVEIVHPRSLAMQMYPTFATAVVWGMRLILAATVYKVLDNWLYPIYKMKDPNARPVTRRPKLNLNNGELGALGQSRARFISAEESTGVTFDDFAGQEYVKRELQEVVKILKDNKEFEDLGIYCPKGVLLYGPPGTGKTLLAKAIAGEAGVPFFSASGAEFVEMFVGVAAARVRDLFTRARQFAPSIIFIDEIDAIGAKRGGPDVGGGGVEREQGLIQILTELDGFQSQGSKVLVVGATNRLDMLDPALLRKGRFDKTISIGLPSEEGRLAILQVHSRNKGFKSEKEKQELLKELASITFDYSGAELQNVLNEAAILAARKDKDIVERPEIMEAIRRQAGDFATGEEDAVDASGEARLRIAYREAAIALLECYLPNPHRPFVKTNVREIDTYPNMEYTDSRHRVFAYKSDLVDSIVRACAPRVVEDFIFGKDNLSWMSGSALSEAGLLADYMILRTGMTALGKVYYRTQQDVMVHIVPKVQALRDEYMRYAVEKCSSILREYRSALETIAERLLEKEEISAPEIWDIFHKAPRIPQVHQFPSLPFFYST
ncbi:hypothetical protein M758_4G074600 [Ceratodon purpureus]|nr:hypothetical protein M758_4G074600 [Ceratodon purpureus]